MDILCSTDMGICYLAAEASADFIKVGGGEEKPNQRNNKKSYTLFITSTLTF